MKTIIQGAKTFISLIKDCPWMFISQKNRGFRYLTSKIAGAFILKERAGRHRLFEVYLLGLRLELFIKKARPMNNSKSRNSQLINLDSSSQGEFSFVQDEKLDVKSYTRSISPESVGLAKAEFNSMKTQSFLAGKI